MRVNADRLAKDLLTASGPADLAALPADKVILLQQRLSAGRDLVNEALLAVQAEIDARLAAAEAAHRETVEALGGHSDRPPRQFLFGTPEATP